MSGPTPELVEALRAIGFPKNCEPGCTLEFCDNAREDVIRYLPSIVRATVPLWEEEVKREVLASLIRDAALAIYGWPDGSADHLCLAVPLVSVTSDAPLTGAVRCDALVALLAQAVKS